MIDKIKEFVLKPFCDMTVKEKLLDIIVTLSLSLIIAFGFSFCSKLNAEEITYYDWEKVEVSELPESSDSTLDKVYVVNDKYYITSFVSGSKFHFNVGDNVCDIDIILEFPDDLYLNLYSNIYDLNVLKVGTSNYNSGSSGLYLESPFSNNSYTNIYFGSNNKIYSFNNKLLVNSTSLRLSSNNFGYGVGCIITNIDNSSGILDYVWYLSNGSYSWEEVSKELVDPFDRHLSDDDFYLFFTFEDISNFNIFSSYDFSVFTDFEKIVVVGLFNILYLGLFFGVVYVFIKLLNKGLSFIFK